MNKNRIAKVGRVMSDRMDKTVVVRVETLKQHPLYKKTIRYRVKFKAHDETNACHIGDMVKIAQTRPLSKTKRWEVVEIVRREQVGEALAPTDIEVNLREETAEVPQPMEEEDDSAADEIESSG